MDGDIGAHSVLGEGSTFWFSIDLPVDTQWQGGHIHTPLDVQNANVLVIDDNAVNRAILLEQLKSWDMQGAAVG